ncbi:MAG: hypothetical protein GC159_16415 [Phycisphaera sp.]|nr:hypothetical protein [Phycisphaera sp.]
MITHNGGDTINVTASTPWRSRVLTRRVLVTSSVLLFAASLTQDGFLISGENPRAWASCFGLLFFGWIGVLQGVFAWLANPLLISSWLLLKARRTRSIMCALAALMFALSFLLYKEIVTDEAGGVSSITRYSAGYWLWVASIAIAVLGAIVWKPRDGDAVQSEPAEAGSRDEIRAQKNGGVSH